jgi:hypothetical protein
VGLDEAHAAYVGGEIVDHARTLGGGTAGFEQGEVAHLVLDARDLLVPLLERLDVDCTDLAMAALLQDADQMAADEPPAPVTTTRSSLDMARFLAVRYQCIVL